MVLIWGAEAAGVGNPTPVIFIFLLYLLATTGELCLSPVGLSAMNRLAPWHMAGLIMGAWFFATAGGNFAAGLISAAAGAGHGEEAGAGKATYLEVWNTVGWITIGIGVFVLVVAPLVKKLMHLDTLRDSDLDKLFGDSELGEPAAAGVHPAVRPQG